MASCTSCKKRTTSFCYVHKVAVCDDCIVTPRDPQLSRCEANCVIRNYFDWLADGEYDFPPLCSLCNRTVTAEPANALRLVCKCLFHPPCLTEALSKRRSDVVPLVDNRGLRCPTCSAALYDPHQQARTKLREQVVRFLEAVDGKEGGGEEGGMTNGRHHKHADGDNKKLSPTAPTAASVAAPASSATAPTGPPSVAPPSSALSSASSASSSSAFVSPLSSAPPPPRPAASQPSRQRSSATLVPASSSSSSSATMIDIGEEKAAPSLFARGQRGKGRAASGRRSGGSSLFRWRLDRVIGCIMLLCFLGSVVLYLMLSNQWLEPSRLSRKG